jgi:hypothetical protein
MSAGGKLAHIPAVVNELNAFGFQGKIQILAALELTCLVLYLFYPTRSFGLILLSSYLGGAIATHWQHEPSLVPTKMIPSSIILVMFWIGSWLLHPDVLWSFGHAKANSAKGQPQMIPQSREYRSV